MNDSETLTAKKKNNLRLPEWPEDWRAAAFGSVAGSGSSLSPDSAGTPPASAGLSPYAGSQHGPEREDEISVRYRVDSSTQKWYEKKKNIKLNDGEKGKPQPWRASPWML